MRSLILALFVFYTIELGGQWKTQQEHQPKEGKEISLINEVGRTHDSDRSRTLSYSNTGLRPALCIDNSERTDAEGSHHFDKKCKTEDDNSTYVIKRKKRVTRSTNKFLGFVVGASSNSKLQADIKNEILKIERSIWKGQLLVTKPYNVGKEKISTIRGAFVSEVITNFHGKPQEAKFREDRDYIIRDVNALTSLLILQCLIEATIYGAAPRINDSNLTLAVSALDEFHAQSYPKGSSVLSVWPEKVLKNGNGFAIDAANLVNANIKDGSTYGQMAAIASHCSNDDCPVVRAGLKGMQRIAICKDHFSASLSNLAEDLGASSDFMTSMSNLVLGSMLHAVRYQSRDGPNRHPIFPAQLKQWKNSNNEIGNLIDMLKEAIIRIPAVKPVTEAPNIRTTPQNSITITPTTKTKTTPVKAEVNKAVSTSPQTPQRTTQTSPATTTQTPATTTQTPPTSSSSSQTQSPSSLTSQAPLSSSTLTTEGYVPNNETNTVIQGQSTQWDNDANIIGSDDNDNDDDDGDDYDRNVNDDDDDDYTYNDDGYMNGVDVDQNEDNTNGTGENDDNDNGVDRAGKNDYDENGIEGDGEKEDDSNEAESSDENNDNNSLVEDADNSIASTDENDVNNDVEGTDENDDDNNMVEGANENDDDKHGADGADEKNNTNGDDIDGNNQIESDSDDGRDRRTSSVDTKADSKMPLSITNNTKLQNIASPSAGSVNVNYGHGISTKEKISTLAVNGFDKIKKKMHSLFKNKLRGAEKKESVSSPVTLDSVLSNVKSKVIRNKTTNSQGNQLWHARKPDKTDDKTSKNISSVTSSPTTTSKRTISTVQFTDERTKRMSNISKPSSPTMTTTTTTMETTITTATTTTTATTATTATTIMAPPPPPYPNIPKTTSTPTNPRSSKKTPKTPIFDSVSYFGIHKYLQEEIEKYHRDVYLIPVQIPLWPQEVNQKQKEERSLPSEKDENYAHQRPQTHFTEIDLTVTAVSVHAVLTASVSRLVDIDNDMELKAIFCSSLRMLTWFMKHQRDLVSMARLSYIPSRFQLYWMSSRIAFQLNLAPVKDSGLFEFAKEDIKAFMKSLRKEMTMSILSSIKDGGLGPNGKTKVYVDDFLGSGDLDDKGRNKVSGDDRLFTSAMAANALISTWSSPTYDSDGLLKFHKETPDSVRIAVNSLVNYISKAVIDPKSSLTNAYVSEKVKGCQSLPPWYPFNTVTTKTGQEIHPTKASNNLKFGVKGYIPSNEYQQEEKNTRFKIKLPTAREINNLNGPTDVFRFWSSEGLTHAICLLAISQAADLKVDETLNG